MTQDIWGNLPPSALFKKITPTYPQVPSISELVFPSGGEEGYVLKVDPTNFKLTGSTSTSFSSSYYNITNTTVTPRNATRNYGIRYIEVPPGMTPTAKIETIPGYVYFNSNDCNENSSFNTSKVAYLWIGETKFRNIGVAYAEWGFSYEVTGKMPGCPRYTTDESFTIYFSASNSPIFTPEPISAIPDPGFNTNPDPPPPPPCDIQIGNDTDDGYFCMTHAEYSAYVASNQGAQTALDNTASFLRGLP